MAKKPDEATMTKISAPRNMQTKIRTNRNYRSIFMMSLLLILPLLALLIYFLELRVQARFIPRVEVSLDSYQKELNGLDKAIAQHADYLWRAPILRTQLTGSQTNFQLPSFYMDRFEVTQREYRKFLGWFVLLPRHRALSYAHISEPSGFTYKNPNGGHKILGRLDVAASGVSFYSAYSFCKAAGGSLPSVEQWMAAAGGSEGRSYPWGEEFIGDSWRYNDPVLNLAAPLANRKLNATPEGIFDLGNGLSEWTLNQTQDKRFIQKGGNNYNRPFMLQSLNFIERPAPATFSSKYSGFRCVYNASQQGENLKIRDIKFLWQGRGEAILVKGGTFHRGAPANSYAPKLITYLEKSSPNVVRSLLSVPLSATQDGVKEERISAISKYEISRAQYRQFLRDPLVRLGFYANKNEPRIHSYVPVNWRQQLAEPQLPVVGVDWWSSYAYAKWAGGRLPTEEEWLVIFGGKKKNPYVWGREYVPGLAHARDLKAGFFPTVPVAVKMTDKDSTSEGIIGLGGNVSEWTSTVAFYNEGINMIVKGGNYKFPGDIGTHYSYDAKVPPNHRSDVIGIRVVFYDG